MCIAMGQVVPCESFVSTGVECTARDFFVPWKCVEMRCGFSFVRSLRADFRNSIRDKFVEYLRKPVIRHVFPDRGTLA